MRGMYSKLPHCVYLKNEKFIINTDFRIFIDFEEEMQGIDINSAINKALFRFYPAFSVIIEKNLLEEAIDKFIWFYKCGKDRTPESKNKSTIKNKRRNRIYSYKCDDLYIWGAFKQYFNVDLSKERLHWWKFRSMWLSIPSSSEYTKIKGYRAYDGDDKDILALQDYHKLPPTEFEIQDQIRRDKIYEALK